MPIDLDNDNGPANATTTPGGRSYINPISGREGYDSVTTLIGRGVPKYLDAWFKKQTATAAVTEQDDWRDLDEPDAIKHIAGACDRIRDNAGDIGTYIHELIETEEIRKPDDQIDLTRYPEARGFLQPARQFLLDWEPHFYWKEVTVYSDTHNYAGTLDFTAVMSPTTGLVLGDFKTSKGVHPEVALQLAAYRWADYAIIDGQQVDIPEVDTAMVVHIRPEGYAVHRLPLTPARYDDFLAAIHVARRDKNVLGYQMGTPRRTMLASRKDTIRARLRRMDANHDPRMADILTKWPNVPSLAKDGHTHQQLDQVVDVMKNVDRAHGQDVVSPETVQALEAQVGQLPPDLLLALESAGIDQGVKGLSGTARAWQINILVDLLADANDEHNRRKLANVSMLNEALGDEDDDVIAHLLALSSDREGVDLEDLMETESENLQALCEAIAEGTLHLLFTEENQPSLTAAPTFIDTYGGKGAVLKAGKAIADRTQLPKPRSSAQVAENPLLAAMVAKEIAS